MKKNCIIVLITLLAGWLFGACQQPADLSKTVIEGQVKGQEAMELRVSYINENGYVEDAIRVQDGKFTYTMPVDFPTELTLGVDWQNAVTLWTEPGVLQLTLDANDLKHYSLRGSKTNELSQKYESQIKTEAKKLNGLYEKMQTASDEERKTLFEPAKVLNDTIRARGLRMMKAHPDSYFAAALLWNAWWGNSMPIAEAQEYIDLLSNEVAANSPYVQRIRQDIQGEIQGRPGQKAPDFSTKDVNGKTFQLSSLSSKKYVIIDFWASWCKPCRAMNPHLKELCKKYEKEGIAVVCVADNDSMPDEWRKAIADDGLEDFIHVLRGHRGMEYFFNTEGDISSKYGIHTLPTKFLIGKDGIILGRYGGNGEPHEAMDDKLKELFGY